MAPVTVDVVLLLPDGIRERACSLSRSLAARMAEQGSRSHFRLGDPYPGLPGGACEPHFSLFMLRIDDTEIGPVLDAVAAVATSGVPVAAEADAYRHNPFGAPELHFHRSAGWAALQQAVVAAIEPLRRGRLRDVDPAGVNIESTIGRLTDTQPHGAELRQLLAYGYDEIVDERDDRFSPHVTLAWPVDADFRVGLEGLPAPESFTGVLRELAVFGMSPFGTCTRHYASRSILGTAGEPSLPV
jgi:hypothetical protein